MAAVGNDLREGATACSQLVADIGGAIDEEKVSRYYRGKAEAAEFVVADRAVDGDVAGALEVLRWGLDIELLQVLVTSALAGDLRADRQGRAGRPGLGAVTGGASLGMPSWEVRRRPSGRARAWRPGRHRQGHRSRRSRRRRGEGRRHRPGLRPRAGGPGDRRRTRPVIPEVDHEGDKRTMLLGYLQRQRDLVLWKVGRAHRPRRPWVGATSGLTIHGIVDHLTDVERSWVRRWFAGRRSLRIGEVDADHVQPPLDLPGARLKDVVNAYRRRRTPALRRGHSEEHQLDDVEVDGDRSLRWVVHHLIEETSRHLGHLDLLRELADGSTGEAP